MALETQLTALQLVWRETNQNLMEEDWYGAARVAMLRFSQPHLRSTTCEASFSIPMRFDQHFRPQADFRTSKYNRLRREMASLLFLESTYS